MRHTEVESMRSIVRCTALLPLLLVVLALPAHADPMDDFNISGGGVTIDLSVPASATGEFGGEFGQLNLGQIPGTVNGVNETIGVNFITGSGCALCQSILISYPSTSLAIGFPFPPFYELTFVGGASGMDETLTFLPGDYMTGTIGIPFSRFEITITPETAATPEPPTLFLFTTAALAGCLLLRRHVSRPTHDL
jgi:hypothetical protein